jgi:hypothetical protein
MLRRWALAIGPVRLVAIGLALVSFGYLWIQTDGRLLEASIWQVPLMLMLLVVSWPWRTVPLRSVVAFFFIGFGPILLLTIVSQAILMATPLHEWVADLGRSMTLSDGVGLGDIHANVWAPITEELWKVAPLLVVFFWRGSLLRRQGGPLDFAILAAATGAGMGFAEDILTLRGPFWDVPGSPLLGLGFGQAYILLLVNVFSAFPLSAFPDFQFGYQGVVGILNPSVEELPFGAIWAGHGVLPAAFGLALGGAVLLRRCYRTRLVYLLPVLVLIWTTYEHFLGNWYRDFTCADAPSNLLCTVASLDLLGGLLPLAAIVGWVGATIASQRILRAHRASDPALFVSRAEVAAAGYPGGTLRRWWSVIRDGRAYVRERNRTAFGFFHFNAAPEPMQQQMSLRLLATRTRGRILAERLRNRTVPEVPAAAREALDSLDSEF